MMGTVRVGVTLNKAVMYICDASLVVSQYCVTPVGRRKGAHSTPTAGGTLEALLPGRRDWALIPTDVRQSHTMKLQGYPRVNNVGQQCAQPTAIALEPEKFEPYSTLQFSFLFYRSCPIE